MNYDVFIYNIAVLLIPCMAIYFFVILFFGSGQRLHSLLILFGCFLGAAIPDVESNSFVEFIRCVNSSALIDGLTALSLSMILFLDKVAFKQVLLLSFATLIHIMVIYDTTIESSYFSLFFYNYYDELIITIGLLQMAVSHNGLRGAIVNILRFTEGMFSRLGDGCSGTSESLHIQKKSKVKT
tara:strand:- start:602 stop:1150 length:549 start_codon:yes stop_codon:yes gene_type:complete